MRVAIIGGGPAGLVSAKSALEVGLTPKVFERESEIGGLWHPDSGGTWESMSTNLSQFSCMFSDFPMKETGKTFPSSLDVYTYLNEYVDDFKLRRFIHLSSRVLSLSREDSDKKWKVAFQINDRVFEETFDCVLVCSGFFSQRAFSELNIENYTGELVHSKDYKNPEPFKDKNVVVIGGSFSGTEIAADVSCTAAHVTHVVSRKFWVLPRLLPTQKGHIPLDLVFYKRKKALRTPLTEEENNKRKHKWFSTISPQEKFSEKLKIDEKDYITPPHVVVSDEYLNSIRSTKIEICDKRVVALGRDGLLLEDASAIKTDAVVMCSGFYTRLPFFSLSQLESLEYDPKCQFQPLILYKGMFHPSVPNLAFIGMYRGPYFGIMELQSRWACMAFANPQKYYPSFKELSEGLSQERKIKKLSPRPQFPYGEYVEFADSIAKRIGVYPRHHIQDNRNIGIAKLVRQGPVIPSHFRLEGPFSKHAVASKTIIKCHSLIRRALLRR